MAKQKISFTQLTHEVVQASPEPLTINEIVSQVDAISAITTKNPKQTIRGAVSQSRLIVATGDGRYGWKARLINGSALRHTLSEAEIVQEVLHWDNDLEDALWPDFFAPQKYRNLGPVAFELPDGTVTQFELEHYGGGVWGSQVTPAFQAWFDSLGAAPGDHLIVRVIDGEVNRYGITFQARSDRDEIVIADRNQAILGAALKLAQRPQRAAIWEITSHLLATGMYQHPVPPDPIGEIWTEEVWGPVVFGYEPDEAALERDLGPDLSALFGMPAQVYDFEDPPDLPREYDPEKGRRHARASRKARKGSVRSYTFRVNHRALPSVWRDIELAEDQTLEDLHLTIHQAYSWWDDHLYSFFLSGQPWDSSSEIGSPWSDASLHTHQVTIERLDLAEGQSFLYLFDYGDGHEFDVTLLQINPLAPKGKYPKILDYHGPSPPQYPDIDEETGEMSWDPHGHYYDD